MTAAANTTRRGLMGVAAPLAACANASSCTPMATDSPIENGPSPLYGEGPDLPTGRNVGERRVRAHEHRTGRAPARRVQLHALGHLARVLEIRFPGILDEWVASMDDEALMSEVVRLRGPVAPPEMKDVRASALA
jgi:hypothetical protein